MQTRRPYPAHTKQSLPHENAWNYTILFKQYEVYKEYSIHSAEIKFWFIILIKNYTPRSQHLWWTFWRWELQAEPLRRWLVVDGQCWQGHQRLPVLHYHRQDPLVGRQTCCFWKSTRGNGMLFFYALVHKFNHFLENSCLENMN